MVDPNIDFIVLSAENGVSEKQIVRTGRSTFRPSGNSVLIFKPTST